MDQRVKIFLGIVGATIGVSTLALVLAGWGAPPSDAGRSQLAAAAGSGGVWEGVLSDSEKWRNYRNAIPGGAGENLVPGTELAYALLTPEYAAAKELDSRWLTEDPGRIYCGDTTIYTISGEDPSSATPELLAPEYAEFWGGDRFHNFAHFLNPFGATSDGVAFPHLPGWRLDGTWPGALANRLQVTELECAGRDCSMVAVPWETADGAATPIESRLETRLRNDVVTWNSYPGVQLERRALVVAQGLGAEVARSAAVQTGGASEIQYIYVDPYIPVGSGLTVGLVSADVRERMQKATFRANGVDPAQLGLLYGAIADVVRDNANDRDPLCDGIESMNSCAGFFALFEAGLVSNTQLECGNGFNSKTRGWVNLFGVDSKFEVVPLANLPPAVLPPPTPPVRPPVVPPVVPPPVDPGPGLPGGGEDDPPNFNPIDGNPKPPTLPIGGGEELPVNPILPPLPSGDGLSSDAGAGDASLSSGDLTATNGASSGASQAPAPGFLTLAAQETAQFFTRIGRGLAVMGSFVAGFF